MSKLCSSVCKQEDLENVIYNDMVQKLKVEQWFERFEKVNNISIPKGILHRKGWEYAFIAIALEERGMLNKHKYGCGFAVGTEPLPAYFASKGCKILATDLNPENAKEWEESGQNVGGDLDRLNELEICPQNVFESKVTYKYVDMNRIPEEMKRGQFDFCWSSCAIEHVGSLEKSKQFMLNMMDVLKPGGVAVHTTEFNISSNEDTTEYGDNVIWRKRDIIELNELLKLRGGGEIYKLDFTLGEQEGDLFVDEFPYYQTNKKYHLRLKLGKYTVTSIGLIIEKKRFNYSRLFIKDVVKILRKRIEYSDGRWSELDINVNKVMNQMSANTAKIDYLENCCRYLARECNKNKWKLIDSVNIENETDEVKCLICGFSQKRELYKTFIAQCIFDGGRLERYVCPQCGAIFGPTKFINLLQEEIDNDYSVHYMGYSEGDSTDRELKTFYMMNPTKDGVYLNYGCGNWSKTLCILHEQGYHVYGYDAYAQGGESPYLITNKKELMKRRFDGIFTNNLIEHLINPVMDFKLMKTLLRSPKSIMAHTSPCYVYSYEYTRFHTCFYTGNAVNVLCDKTGLEIIGKNYDENIEDFICYIFKPHERYIDYLPHTKIFRKGEYNQSELWLYPDGVAGGQYLTLEKGKYQWQYKFRCKDVSTFVVRCRVTSSVGEKTLQELNIEAEGDIIIDIKEEVENFEIVFYNLSIQTICIEKLWLIGVS